MPSRTQSPPSRDGNLAVPPGGPISLAAARGATVASPTLAGPLARYASLLFRLVDHTHTREDISHHECPPTTRRWYTSVATTPPSHSHPVACPHGVPARDPALLSLNPAPGLGRRACQVASNPSLALSLGSLSLTPQHNSPHLPGSQPPLPRPASDSHSPSRTLPLQFLLSVVVMHRS